MDNKYLRKNPIKTFNLNQTMYSLVTNEAERYLDYKATEFLGNSMTYEKLFETSDELANAFNYYGVKEGDNVAILTISMPMVQQCLLSLSKIGSTMSWLDVRVKEKDLLTYLNSNKCKIVLIFDDLLPLIERVIDDTQVEKVVVCSPKYYLNPAIRILADLKDKKEGKKVILPSDKRFITFSDFIRKGKHQINVSPVNFMRDRKSLIIQSSGSTGKPKQIVHTEYNFNSEVQKMSYLDLPLYRGNTMSVAVPPFVIYGLGNSVYLSLAHTMKADMIPNFNENVIYNRLGKFDISFAVPLHYRYILNQIKKLQSEIEELSKYNDSNSKKELKNKLKELSSVLKGIEKTKVFVTGGDKIGEEELIEMQQTFNKAVVNGYGNNECMGATIVSPMYANKPGSIGIPMHGVEIKFVNPETGKTLQNGELGELYISSDNLFVEYLGKEAETNEIKSIDSEGKPWVKTGDLCIVDSDGFIFPKGRSRRLIKKEAFKIDPITIEEVIASLPYVKECVVVGVPDEKYESVPMAFLRLEENICLNDVYDDILRKCSVELPDYEIPSYFEQLDKMPYTPNGKYDFVKLEESGKAIVEKNKGKRKTLNV